MDIKLEQDDGQHVGWSRIGVESTPPRVLFVGSTAYYYGGYFEGATRTPEQAKEYWLYKLTKPLELTDPVTKERPQ